MFRTFRSVLAIAAAAAMSFATFVVEPIHDVVIASYSWARAQAVDCIVSLARADEPPRSKPRVLLVKAVAFVASFIKRERPVVTPQWRLIPST